MGTHAGMHKTASAYPSKVALHDRTLAIMCSKTFKIWSVAIGMHREDSVPT